MVIMMIKRCIICIVWTDGNERIIFDNKNNFMMYQHYYWQFFMIIIILVHGSLSMTIVENIDKVCDDIIDLA